MFGRRVDLVAFSHRAGPILNCQATQEFAPREFGYRDWWFRHVVPMFWQVKLCKIIAKPYQLANWTSENINNFLNLRNMLGKNMLGKSKKYSPKWWWKMVIYHGTIRKNLAWNKSKILGSNLFPPKRLIRLTIQTWPNLCSSLNRNNARIPPDAYSKQSRQKNTQRMILHQAKKILTDRCNILFYRIWLRLLSNSAQPTLNNCCPKWNGKGVHTSSCGGANSRSGEDLADCCWWLLLCCLGWALLSDNTWQVFGTWNIIPLSKWLAKWLVKGVTNHL